jgi:hypothetical protein
LFSDLLVFNHASHSTEGLSPPTVFIHAGHTSGRRGLLAPGSHTTHHAGPQWAVRRGHQPHKLTCTARGGSGRALTG